LVFGGTRDPDDLAAYATLAGERDEDVPTFDHTRGQTSTTIRRVPVLSAAQIAQLPAGRVMVVSRGMPVTIGRVQMAWRRRDVRRANRPVQVPDWADAAEIVEPAGLVEPVGQVAGALTAITAD
jgi:hypothetical protein